MVERLKAAIEKARQERIVQEVDRAPAARPAAGGAIAERWLSLPALTLDPGRMTAERLVSFTRDDPGHAAFDVMRARLIKFCQDNNWRRVGFASKTPRCGKSFVCLNLAFSLARHPELRTVVFDLDLRAPRLARYLGVREGLALRELLAQAAPIEHHLRRVGDRLAFALNERSEVESAEIMHHRSTIETLARVEEHLKPDMTLVDLPPLQFGADALGFLGNLDAVLLIAAAGRTTVSDIRESERLIVERTNFLGVIMNQVADEPPPAYAYYGESP